LSLVTETQHLEILSDQDNCFLGNERQNERIDKVYKYVMKNSSTPISLTEVAKQIHMSTEAFCRFFKRSTGNTLNEFIQKTRLARVCQDLMQSELSITEIAFDHGFNNLSNFNRQFRKYKRMTPRDYRKIFQESPLGTPTEHLSNKWEADMDFSLFDQNSITSS
jgi:AraC-like DNA-binding protein